MTTTSAGQEAESSAAEYLRAEGFEILERNFRTPVCEIDIVVKKDNCIYFVEVKYRSHDIQGSGLEYITPRKLKQMRFAADTWLREQNWQGEVTLSAIEVGDPNFQINNFIESI